MKKARRGGVSSSSTSGFPPSFVWPSSSPACCDHPLLQPRLIGLTYQSTSLSSFKTSHLLASRTSNPSTSNASRRGLIPLNAGRSATSCALSSEIVSTEGGSRYHAFRGGRGSVVLRRIRIARKAVGRCWSEAEECELASSRSVWVTEWPGY